MSKPVTPDAFHETEHEQNDNWMWSDSFTEFIVAAIEGTSLKVCTGLRPIADVNLDLKDLRTVADSPDAEFSVTSIKPDDKRAEKARELLADDADPSHIYGQITADNTTDGDLYDGYACHGDMYELPFDNNTFTTTISDPPWLTLSEDDRKKLFDELVRVTKPTGVILYNSTWKPKHTDTNRYKLRFRQQLDFWGGPSFATFHRRLSRTIPELFDAYNYESTERYPEDSAFWSEAYHPNALSTDHNTDPKKVSSDPDHHDHCCPMCGYAQLGQLRTEHFENNNGEYTTYQCHNCEFRVDANVIEKLAAALQRKATQQNIDVTDVQSIEHTPDCVAKRINDYEHGYTPSLTPLTPDLPWTPTHRLNLLTGQYGLSETIDNLDLSIDEACTVLERIETDPTINNRTDGDLTQLDQSELESLVKTHAKTINNPSATLSDFNTHSNTPLKSP